jgi:hypothetical protein
VMRAWTTPCSLKPRVWGGMVFTVLWPIQLLDVDHVAIVRILGAGRSPQRRCWMSARSASAMDSEENEWLSRNRARRGERWRRRPCP